MNRSIGRLASLTTALALVLALGAAAPAAAAEAPVRVKSAERYGLDLLNCTRSGGWVKADGTCIGRGTGKYSVYRKPLRLHRKISRQVAAPWAKNMVIANVCDHVIAGKPQLTRRLRREGFKGSTYGENVGCGWGYGDPKDVVLMAHRMFQKEKPWKGGHWRNIKNKAYKSVGVGVATRNGRTMVVFDFYGNLYY